MSPILAANDKEPNEGGHMRASKTKSEEKGRITIPIPGVGYIYRSKSKRSNGEVYVNQTWWVSYKKDGIERRESSQTKDEKIAVKFLYEQSGKKDQYVAPDSRTLKEFGDHWLKTYAATEVKESTYQEYEAVLKNHVYPFKPYGSSSSLGDKKFTEVTRRMIKDLIAAKKAEGYERSTIRNIIAPVRGIYNEAIDDEVIDKNPAVNMGKRSRGDKDKPKKKINPLTREEVRLFLATVIEKRLHYYPIFLTAVRTGLRQGEVAALKCADVNFADGSQHIHVQRTLSRRGKITPPKNGKDRKVDMSDQTAKVLNDLISNRRQKALEAEMMKPSDQRRDRDTVIDEVMDDWLFQTPVIERTELAIKRRPNVEGRGGTRLDPSNLRKLFYRLLTVDAKLRRIRFHDLRHTFASLLLGNKESLVHVKEQMGHSSIQITVDTYGHLIPGSNRAAVNMLDDYELPTTTAEGKAT
jgi:integrase